VQAKATISKAPSRPRERERGYQDQVEQAGVPESEWDVAYSLYIVLALIAYYCARRMCGFIFFNFRVKG